jgi:hypothetical protein
MLPRYNNQLTTTTPATMLSLIFFYPNIPLACPEISVLWRMLPSCMTKNSLRNSVLRVISSYYNEQTTTATTPMFVLVIDYPLIDFSVLGHSELLLNHSYST